MTRSRSRTPYRYRSHSRRRHDRRDSYSSRASEKYSDHNKPSESKSYRDDRRRYSPPSRRSPGRSRPRSPPKVCFPSGVRAPVFKVPSTFAQTRDFLDSNQVYKLDFPVKVLTTDFTEKIKIAGMPVSEVRLWQMCYMKEENWMLRWLAQGNWLSIEFARSVAESVLSSKILSLLRNSQDQTLEDLGRHYAASINLPFSDLKEQKVVYNKLAEMAVSNLRTVIPPKPDEQANKRIKELEKQLADAKAASAQGPNHESSTVVQPKPQVRGKAKAKAAPTQLPTDDDYIDDDNIFAPAHRPSSKVLSKSAPDGVKPHEVKMWIDGLGLGHQKKEQLHKVTNQIQAKFKASTSESKQDDLEELAREWGLPMRTIVNTQAVQLIRIISAAYTQTN